uniref:Uncharacterized protein n=1 Tax=Pararge aegeria TaxID=116150 RepID=S4PSD0_9NEOP
MLSYKQTEPRWWYYFVFLKYFLFSFSFSPSQRKLHGDRRMIIILYLMLRFSFKRFFHKAREYYLLSVHYEL